MKIALTFIISLFFVFFASAQKDTLRGPRFNLDTLELLNFGEAHHYMVMKDGIYKMKTDSFIFAKKRDSTIIIHKDHLGDKLTRVYCSINFKKEGYEYEFFENGKVHVIRYYSNDKMERKMYRLNSKGRVFEEYSYKNGMRNGFTKSYAYKGNKLMVMEHYKEGQKDGLLIRFYKNGKILSKSNYIHGKVHGLSYIYYKNGGVKIQSEYN